MMIKGIENNQLVSTLGYSVPPNSPAKGGTNPGYSVPTDSSAQGDTLTKATVSHPTALS